ncbi:MAG: hypothetical protein IKK50_06085, partial [Ruminiclostridium sp.]|nr:hypothetical protein [Ruminiclostridium sp.]
IPKVGDYSLTRACLAGTLRLRSVFRHAHVAPKNESNFLSPLRRRNSARLYLNDFSLTDDSIFHRILWKSGRSSVDKKNCPHSPKFFSQGFSPTRVDKKALQNLEKMEFSTFPGPLLPLSLPIFPVLPL